MVFGKLFGPPCVISLDLVGTEGKKTVDVPKESAEGGTDTFFVYAVGDSISGKIAITLNSKKIEHQGIRVEVVGQIIVSSERTDRFDFANVVKELAEAGDLVAPVNYEFSFPNVEMPYESYSGINARVRYSVRVIIQRSYASNVVQEKEFWVQQYTEAPLINPSIKMEVGIEDALHIEFEYDRQKYHLKDVVVGKIYFLLVKIRIKHMEVALIRRESTGSGPSLYTESETLTRFEVMDGAPVRGESIPVRMFLSAYPLTPTYSNVNNKFSVRYYLNLFIIDDSDRRYFKQVEVILWRQKDEQPAQTPAAASQ
eukprot:ANDGO_03836.mRNA.1 Vacuolar protein sorting-associated protein 26